MCAHRFLCVKLWTNLKKEKKKNSILLFSPFSLPFFSDHKNKALILRCGGVNKVAAFLDDSDEETLLSAITVLMFLISPQSKKGTFFSLSTFLLFVCFLLVPLISSGDGWCIFFATGSICGTPSGKWSLYYLSSLKSVGKGCAKEVLWVSLLWAAFSGAGIQGCRIFTSIQPGCMKMWKPPGAWGRASANSKDR